MHPPTTGPHPVTDTQVPLLLAVYGTLRRGCRNHHLLAGCEHVADAGVQGRLHRIRTPLGRRYTYPALLVASPDRPHEVGPVRVEVYRVGAPDVLRELDVLEAYDPDDPAGSEYVRVRVPLLGARPPADAAPEGELPTHAQVYDYAGDPAGLGDVLPGGDWYAFEAGLG